MTFTFSKHAEHRIIERGLEFPNQHSVLSVIGRKTKKKLRALCKKNGVDQGKIYWLSRIGTVYVCEQTGIGTYHVITAFKIT